MTHYDLTHCPSLPPPQQRYDEPPPNQGWEPHKGLTKPHFWSRYHPTTIALINSASWVGLPSITPLSLSEWAYRLSSLYDAGMAFHHFPSAPSHDGSPPSPPLPLLLSLSDIRAHVGARFTCPQLTLVAFHAQIRHLRLAPILKSLSQEPPHAGR